ncbi:MAG: neutral zinc metallopeptidase [Deltaproteobacteria bacterium]|nr:neutral zinc metallopeptidase [Deltaproteobacteria bacterium]
MRGDDNYDSSDVEDRRSDRAPRESGGGGLGLLFDLIYWLGWKRGLVVFGLIGAASYLLGPVLGGGSAGPAQHAGHDEARAFVGYVLDDVQKTWADRVPNYRRAKVVLYADATTTGCGMGESAVGPFYCPNDERVYLDVTFFEELRTRFGAPGNFAQAYVIAHELGHHLQKLDGTSDRVQHASRSQLQGEGGLSVKLELQADCYAGVWAASAEKRGLLEPGDLDQAITAAASVGDDRLQRQATGTVQPETWTHGSSAERKHWFRAGHDSGELRACDTFH